MRAAAQVVPLMDKALSPYVKGGGAKKYEEELRRMYGMDGSPQVLPPCPARADPRPASHPRRATASFLVTVLAARRAVGGGRSVTGIGRRRGRGR